MFIIIINVVCVRQRRIHRQRCTLSSNPSQHTSLRFVRFEGNTRRNHIEFRCWSHIRFYVEVRMVSNRIEWSGMNRKNGRAKYSDTDGESVSVVWFSYFYEMCLRSNDHHHTVWVLLDHRGTAQKEQQEFYSVKCRAWTCPSVAWNLVANSYLLISVRNLKHFICWPNCRYVSTCVRDKYPLIKWPHIKSK